MSTVSVFGPGSSIPPRILFPRIWERGFRSRDALVACPCLTSLPRYRLAFRKYWKGLFANITSSVCRKARAVENWSFGFIRSKWPPKLMIFWRRRPFLKTAFYDFPLTRARAFREMRNESSWTFADSINPWILSTGFPPHNRSSVMICDLYPWSTWICSWVWDRTIWVWSKMLCSMDAHT